jgi:hypothetical protein
MTKYILLPYQRYEILQGAYKGADNDETTHPNAETTSKDTMRKRAAPKGTRDRPPPPPPPLASSMAQQRRVIRKRSKTYNPVEWLTL